METIVAAIITGIISLVIGFFGGYSIGINIKKKQIQKSGNNSNQIQIGEINK